MVNKGQQLRMKRNVERLFSHSCGRPVAGFLKDLAALGFTQTGGDQIALQFENAPFELFLGVFLDTSRCVHRYEVLTIPELKQRQQKVRW